jgi:hypothetical protein
MYPFSILVEPTRNSLNHHTIDLVVDIDTLVNFKRMTPYADKRDLIIDAVNASFRLKLNDDNTKVARVDPLPDPDVVLSRMIYVVRQIYY